MSLVEIEIHTYVEKSIFGGEAKNVDFLRAQLRHHAQVIPCTSPNFFSGLTLIHVYVGMSKTFI